MTTMSNEDRSWMYQQFNENGTITEAFKQGVKQFLEYVKSRPNLMSDGLIRCPCATSSKSTSLRPRLGCNNRKFVRPDEVVKHLMRYGFRANYEVWVSHGEKKVVDRHPRTNAASVVVGPTMTPSTAQRESEPIDVNDDHDIDMTDMVMDAAGPDFVWDPVQTPTNKPNKEVHEWLHILNAAQEPVFESSRQSVLEATAEFLNIKTENNMSQKCYNQIMDGIQKLLPENNKMTKSWNDTCKIVKKLGLGYQLIDACKNDCQLYWNSTKDDIKCRVCDYDRYKPRKEGGGRMNRIKHIPYKQLRYLPLVPRLKRLYTCKDTAMNMKWHKNCPREEGLLSHPSDGESWKNFDETYPNFADDPRNVRLCLSSDGFNPFGGSAKAYSCWPVIVTPLNLPPWLCMTEQYMFLTLLVPGPRGPGKNLDIYLQPLVDELQGLWNNGVETWDASTKQNFSMKAALMWTVNDFPAYGYLSGWSTHGELSCPYCMEHTKAFRLKEGKKPCFFDCHRQFLPENHPFRSSSQQFRKGRVERDVPPPRLSGDEILQKLAELGPDKWGMPNAKFNHPGFGKDHHWKKRSVFWDLPYWKTNLVRHNLDVMHIEKNIFDNIFNTVMDIPCKSKDNARARIDMQEHCNRRGLELIRDERGNLAKPKARYTLTREERLKVLKWVRTLRLPDGYASNLSSCANLETCKMNGMKSHDCHVFLERLLPIAFRDLLPDAVLTPLAELSEFFRVICSSILRVEDLQILEKNIAITLCKLEKIFPPAFFDSMEHLPIHLAYEARVGGPVQYRWMYPFERFLNTLKRKVKNKSKVEGSICRGYLMREAATFCSHYLDSEISTKLTSVGRNDDGGERDNSKDISVFSYPGRPLGNPIKGKHKSSFQVMTESQKHVARTYVLLNCDEVVKNYVGLFEEFVRLEEPNITRALLEVKKDNDFYKWFKDHIKDHPEEEEKYGGIIYLSQGPHNSVQRYNGYYVNGYAFHTEEYGGNKSTMNSGVVVKGPDVDYYGKLSEVIELSYLGGRKVVLFNCTWFNSIIDKGIKLNPMCDVVDVNIKLRHGGKDTYVLASQAHQCYFTEYAFRKKGSDHWWAVLKTKARGRVDIPYKSISEEIGSSLPDEFYQETVMPHISPTNDGDADLDNPNFHSGFPGEDIQVNLDEESELGSEEEEEEDLGSEMDGEAIESEESASDSDDEEAFVH